MSPNKEASWGFSRTPTGLEAQSSLSLCELREQSVYSCRPHGLCTSSPLPLPWLFAGDISNPQPSGDPWHQGYAIPGQEPLPHNLCFSPPQLGSQVTAPTHSSNWFLPAHNSAGTSCVAMAIWLYISLKCCPEGQYKPKVYRSEGTSAKSHEGGPRYEIRMKGLV